MKTVPEESPRFSAARRPRTLPHAPEPHGRPARSARPGRGESSGGDTAEILADELRHGLQSAEMQPRRESQQVLLDKQINGFRLLLIRTAAEPDHTVALSPRELEIARMIGKGLPNKIIADVLEISFFTVGTHLRRIFAKFGVTSRAAMVARLLEVPNLSSPAALPAETAHAAASCAHGRAGGEGSNPRKRC